MSIFTPFSAGLLFQNIRELRCRWRFHPKGEVQIHWPMCGWPLCAASNLNSLYWHTDESPYSDILTGWDDLQKHPTPLFAHRARPTRQPSWDMNDPCSPVNWNPEASPSESEITEDAPNADTPQLSSIGYRHKVELLAWYSPAHFSHSWDYGIHLSHVGVAKAAAGIEACHGNASAVPSRRTLTVLAAYILYAHELCHAYIEDVASSLEFHGASVRYRLFQREVDSYCLMEEALCNTFAFAAAVRFLRAEPWHKALEEPALSTADMLVAVKKWMRSQPPGYKDFLATEKEPDKHGLLWINFARLLADAYGFPSHDIVEAMGVIGIPQYGEMANILRRDPPHMHPGFLEGFEADKVLDKYGWPLHIHDAQDFVLRLNE